MPDVALVGGWFQVGAAALVAYIAYHLGRLNAEQSGVRWTTVVAVTLGCVVFAAYSAWNLGTVREDADDDPIRGGGTRVTVEDVSGRERWQHRTVLFALAALPCWVGMYRGHAAYRLEQGRRHAHV